MSSAAEDFGMTTLFTPCPVPSVLSLPQPYQKRPCSGSAWRTQHATINPAHTPADNKCDRQGSRE